MAAACTSPSAEARRRVAALPCLSPTHPQRRRSETRCGSVIQYVSGHFAPFALPFAPQSWPGWRRHDDAGR